MSKRENTVSVKEEPNNTWIEASDDYILDSVDTDEAENVVKFPFYQLSAHHMSYNHHTALQEKLDEKVLIDVKRKDDETELNFSSTIGCKTEDQRCRPIVKMENENQINDTNENIFIDVECKYPAENDDDDDKDDNDGRRIFSMKFKVGDGKKKATI
ncbi:hypothetical protein TKK_0008668 [Trichogramma kaykai]